MIIDHWISQSFKTLRRSHVPDNNYFQGFNKLSQPFLDTLSRYELDRDGVIEQTWDNVQTEVVSSLVIIKIEFTIYFSYDVVAWIYPMIGLVIIQGLYLSR